MACFQFTLIPLFYFQNYGDERTPEIQIKRRKLNAEQDVEKALPGNLQVSVKGLLVSFYLHKCTFDTSNLGDYLHTPFLLQTHRQNRP